MIDILLIGIVFGIALGTLIVWHYKDYKLIKDKKNERKNNCKN